MTRATQDTTMQAGGVSIPISVHDRRHWMGRALYYDVLALTVLLLSALALGVDLYAAGYLRATTAAAAGASFAPLARLALEGALFIASFAWVAARLVRAAYREIPSV